METDAFKARMNAKVRQRSLNEPNLYDKEIFRVHRQLEPRMRNANGGSCGWSRCCSCAPTAVRKPVGAAELERRIGNELESVRA